MSHLLEEVKMKALGCLINLRDKYAQNHFKQLFANLASQLELDDVGYLYNPNKPNEYYTTPGQLLGEVCNINLPSFNFGVGFNTTMAALNCLDDDYKKTLIAITDNIKNTDVYYIKETLKFNKNIDVSLFVLGKKYLLLENFQFESITKICLESIHDINLSEIIL